MLSINHLLLVTRRFGFYLRLKPVVSHGVVVMLLPEFSTQEWSSDLPRVRIRARLRVWASVRVRLGLVRVRPAHIES